MTGGENNTQIDCVLWTDDVTIMTPSSKKFLFCMFKIKLPTKRIFRIFSILRINGMAPFCNLFMERPSFKYKNKTHSLNSRHCSINTGIINTHQHLRHISDTNNNAMLQSQKKTYKIMQDKQDRTLWRCNGNTMASDRYYARMAFKITWLITSLTTIKYTKPQNNTGRTITGWPLSSIIKYHNNFLNIASPLRM